MSNCCNINTSVERSLSNFLPNNIARIASTSVGRDMLPKNCCSTLFPSTRPPIWDRGLTDSFFGRIIDKRYECCVMPFNRFSQFDGFLPARRFI